MQQKARHKKRVSLHFYGANSPAPRYTSVPSVKPGLGNWISLFDPENRISLFEPWRRRKREHPGLQMSQKPPFPTPPGGEAVKIHREIDSMIWLLTMNLFMRPS